MKERSEKQKTKSRKMLVGVTVTSLIVVGLVSAAIIETTLRDFLLSGTQVGDVQTEFIHTSSTCQDCHESETNAPTGVPTDPMGTWNGSLMAMAGRDPLFYAQMATANQDVANAGYFCMRCHVPLSMVSGHALDADGSTLDEYDMDGVSCHFCHSMVDPIYKDGISPPEDFEILAGLDQVPEHPGNAMFVLDPQGRRRGPREDAQPLHEFLYSPFHRTSEYCGTCHEVGNVAVTRQQDGTYLYNAIDEPTPDENPWTQFPLERTFTEWNLSSFANGGVDMGGRFGGYGVSTIESCQDCHMPRQPGRASPYAPARPDIATHEFAGSATWVLDIIGIYYADDPAVDLEALKRARLASESMLQRAATLEVARDDNELHVRVINQTGHKLPTGHIEGRRVFVNVKYFDRQRNLIEEYGHYDLQSAHLDEESTQIYEMKVGLSEYAAKVTGLDQGVTTHMALADTIEYDSRIPPRGFDNARYEEGGAPVVGHEYDDGQYWDDVYYPIPSGAAGAKVTLYYQTVTRHYIEALLNGNETDHWGDTLYELWKQTDKAPPVEMTTMRIRF